MRGIGIRWRVGRWLLRGMCGLTWSWDGLAWIMERGNCVWYVEVGGESRIEEQTFGREWRGRLGEGGKIDLML